MSALYEYKQFLSKKAASLSLKEKEIANLILSNFRNVSEKSKHGGSRSKFIYSLINQNLDTLNSDLNVTKSEKTGDFKLSRITKLIAKNFRGFQEEITFDLEKPYAFIFGENGSGKSSFFEAIEYALTGQISEAKTKRYDVAAYATNVESKKLDYPLLKGIFNNENESPITADISKHSSVLFEKNRIEGFAKVSSFTKTIQQERLSILFGLDDFSNFCTNFSLISQYLPQENFAQKKRIQSTENIKLSQKAVDSRVIEIEKITKDASVLLAPYPDCSNSAELLKKIEGDDNQLGLLKNKQDELAKLNNVKTKNIAVANKFLEHLDELNSLIHNVNTCANEVSKFKNELSLKSLYELIINTKSILDSAVCPACQSDIYDADGNLLLNKNPFLHSQEMLNSLADIQKKEKLLIDSRKSFDSKLPLFIATVSNINNIITNKLNEDIVYNDFDALKKVHVDLKKFGELAKKEIEDFNKNIEAKLKTKSALQKEVFDLDALKTKLIELRTHYKLANKSKKETEAAIVLLNESHAPLIEAANEEQKKLTKLQEIEKAYVSLTDKLKAYNENLPIEFSKDLSELVLSLYNSINYHPYDSEVLKSLSLPTKPDSQITISYLDGTTADALKILSEGHLKCLGLSILLAKNIKDKQSILVFDDVVNAIDDEHRKGVRDTLFNNGQLKGHQLIITTHASEFLKHMENMVGEYDSNAIRYDFCNKTNGRKITLKNSNTFNEITKARRYMENNKTRDCLMQLRRVLEFLAPLIWKKIANKKYDSAISLMFHNPSFAPNLSNYLLVLNKKLKELANKANATAFIRHQEILETILNLGDKNPIINHYLNKATHYEEREEEFDDQETEELLQIVEELNTLLISN
jgi:recombinational DNA repair ATPase RecF